MRNNRPPHRYAEILDFTPDSVTVAVAWLKSQDWRGTGLVAFVCPFCCETHLHGTGEGFGGGDGHRVPHCRCDGCRRPGSCRFKRLPPDIQAIVNQLAPDWQFILREVTDTRRAGNFPRHLRSRLASRVAKADA